MKRQIALIKSGIMSSLRFRGAVLVTLIGNLIYIVIVYSLWRGIFSSAKTDVLNGMTFNDTMIYLVLASSMFTMLESYMTWRMHDDIQSGQIVPDLIKPMNYQSYKYCGLIGEMLFSFVSTVIPTFVLVYFLSGRSVTLSYNLVFFFVSMILGVLISLTIDFMVGTICLYTQSVWGINMIKEVILLLFSGAVIPLAFFPEGLRRASMYLPFQAIYNSPLQQLIGKQLQISKRFEMLLVQIAWLCILLILSKLFWNKSIKILTVNGG